MLVWIDLYFFVGGSAILCNIRSKGQLKGQGRAQTKYGQKAKA